MPQKFRQRGKKKSKKAKEDQQAAAVEEPAWTIDRGHGEKKAVEEEREGFDGGDEDGAAAPGEHIPIQEADLAGGSNNVDDVAPFGFVSPELKGYLKDALASLHQMQTKRSEDWEAEEDDDGQEQSEQASRLRLAMLREMNGQELACATDGEASIALEAIIAGLDGRRLRILADRMSGSCYPLAGHRFGSHVLQAILRHLQRDLSGKGKERHIDDDAAETSAGVLRSSQQLIFDLVDELTPHTQELLQSTFGTHVVRSMLQLLAGQDLHAMQRSKKSKAFRAKVQQQDGAVERAASLIPFPDKLKEVRHACLPKDITGRNEARALLVSPSASPTFALLLSLEAQAGEATQPDSLADVVLEGPIAADVEANDAHESQYGVETLLRHPSGSHALEGLLSQLPQRIASRFWSTYVRGKVTRLFCHPVANFVCAAAAKRLDAGSVREALEEIKEKQGGKMIKESRTAVLLALMARAAWWETQGEGGLEALALAATMSAFGFDAPEDANSESDGLMVRAILALKTKDGWHKMMRRRKEKEAAQAKEAEEKAKQAEDTVEELDAGGMITRGSQKRKRGNEEGATNGDDAASLRPEEATVQGSVMLQALVRLSEPHNHILYESLLSLRTPAPYLTNPTTSHAYLGALSSPTRPYTYIRRWLLSQLSPLLLSTLADDKYGSRVADAAWLRMDLFTREKFMKTHFASPGGSEERRLQGAFYGRHFLTKRLRVAEWHRDHFKWKEGQAEMRAREEEAEKERTRTLASEAADDVTQSEDGETKDGENGERGDTGAATKKRRKERKEKTKNETELDAIFAGV